MPPTSIDRGIDDQMNRSFHASQRSPSGRPGPSLTNLPPNTARRGVITRLGATGSDERHPAPRSTGSRDASTRTKGAALQMTATGFASGWFSARREPASRAFGFGLKVVAEAQR